MAYLLTCLIIKMYMGKELSKCYPEPCENVTSFIQSEKSLRICQNSVLTTVTEEMTATGTEHTNS